MSKIAFVKDIHTLLGLPKPLSRTESYHKDIWVKYISFRDKLIERGITTIVFTGDIYTHKAPSKYDVNSIHMYDELFLELWGDFDKYTIRGNHDMFIQKNGKHANSIFEIGIKHGWYKSLEGNPLDLGDIIIYGLDFDPSVENLKTKIKDLSDKAINQSFLNKKTAIVLHEHLVPNTKDMFLNSYILYDWFTDYDFDYVVGGHLHKGIKTQTIDDVTFINPWSFVRLARDHYSVDDRHKPSFVYLNIEDGQEKEIKTVGLKHRPYDKSFTQTVISESNLMGDISAFKAKIEQAGSIANIDIELIKKLSGDLESVNEGDVKEAIVYIESLIKNGYEDE